MNGNESLTTTEIKKQNCKKVFDYLYQNQRTSKQTIAQALGLSMPTVSQNLKLLEGAGMVRRDGFYESTGGRKAHVLRFVQDARVAVGVAILEGSVQLCAVDLLGEAGIRVRSLVVRCPLPLRWLCYLLAVYTILIFGIYGPGFSAAQFIYFQF